MQSHDNDQNPSSAQDPTMSTTIPTLQPDVPDRIRVKNRRKRYLDTHPEYFGPQLELAGLSLLPRCEIAHLPAPPAVVLSPSPTPRYGKQIGFV